MNRSIIVCLLTAALLQTGFLAEAQQPGKIYRVGWLRFLSSPPTGATHDAFRQGLHELGYVEGENLVLEYRSAKGKREGRPKAAAELVRLKVDVIVTSPAPPLIRAAQQATRTIPIVMAGVYVDPVEAGFVESLARPGGNITGISNFESDLHAKRLELLKEAFPEISRVAILWPEYQQIPAKKEIEAAGAALGLQIQSVAVGGSADFETVFSAISLENPDALLVASGSFTLRHQARIREFTAEKRLPTMYARGQYVEAGGLMSYGADLPDLWRRTATHVGTILKGAKPADLPVERPRRFELVINLKTAKALGLTIPPEVLYRADKVIK